MARDCQRRLVAHCSAAVTHSEGFVTKLPLVNTLITRCRSHGLALSRNRSWLSTSQHAYHTRYANANVLRISILFHDPSTFLDPTDGSRKRRTLNGSALQFIERFHRRAMKFLLSLLQSAENFEKLYDSSKYVPS